MEQPRIIFLGKDSQWEILLLHLENLRFRGFETELEVGTFLVLIMGVYNYTLEWASTHHSASG